MKTKKEFSVIDTEIGICLYKGQTEKECEGWIMLVGVHKFNNMNSFVIRKGRYWRTLINVDHVARVISKDEESYRICKEQNLLIRDSYYRDKAREEFGRIMEIYWDLGFEETFDLENYIVDDEDLWDVIENQYDVHCCQGYEDCPIGLYEQLRNIRQAAESWFKDYLDEQHREYESVIVGEI